MLESQVLISNCEFCSGCELLDEFSATGDKRRRLGCERGVCCRIRDIEDIGRLGWGNDGEEECVIWYNLSKTLAEDAAWKFVKENNIDMVTMNPALVVGPLLQPELNTSSAMVLDLVDGSPTFKNITLGWVDVRDVAMAHVLAYESASANGRYLLVERVTHFSNVVKILRDLYPTLQLPEKCVDDKPYDPAFQVSKEKAKSLRIEYIPLEVSIKDTVESLKEKNFVKF
ncbi:hypothetical protein ACSQ67_009903 [Phaseolus vulgaris]